MKEWNCEAYSNLLRADNFWLHNLQFSPDFPFYCLLLFDFIVVLPFFASLSIKDRKLCSICGAISPLFFKRKKAVGPHAAFTFDSNLLLRSFVESQKVIFTSSPKSPIFQPSIVFWTIAPVKRETLFSPLMSSVVFGNDSISANRLWSLYHTAEWMT